MSVSDVPEWRLTFQDSESFRNLVEATASVMPKVVFHVSKEGSERVLSVEGSDMALTCWLRARLLVDVFDFPKGGEADRETFAFCVECKHILIAIDNATLGHCAVLLEGFEGRAKVRVHVQDPDMRGSLSEQADLDTFVDGDRPQQRLQRLDYKMQMEIDVMRLRDLVRKARRAHAEFVRFTITIRARGVSSNQISVVEMSYHGDIHSKVIFRNKVITDELGSMVVRAVSDHVEEEEGQAAAPAADAPSHIFSGAYALDKIEAFLKVVKCRVIVSRVEQDQPMLFEVPLGGDGTTSYIHLLIAPKIDDDDMAD